MIDHVTDWLGRLRGRIAEQFKGLPNFDAIVAAYAEQIQALEESGQALALLASIDPVTSDVNSPLYGIGRGVQLDVIGLLVGQKRLQADDATYRLYLRARIKTNESSGVAEDLYAIFVALFAGAGRARAVPMQIATLVFQVFAPTLDAQTEAVLIQFLRDAHIAGVRLLLEWQPVDDAHSFACAGGDGLGFAVFGRVVEGMEIVRAILNAPTSPTEGQGVMRGQMLMPRVRILSTFR